MTRGIRESNAGVAGQSFLTASSIGGEFDSKPAPEIQLSFDPGFSPKTGTPAALMGMVWHGTEADL